MRSVKTVLAGVALAITSVSCGDVVRQGRSPMFLVIESLAGQRGGDDSAEFGNPLLSDVDPVFNDVGEVVFRLEPKDVISAATNAPTSNNAVTMTRYRVTYSRTDGRNTQGVDVPHAFDGVLTGNIVYGTPAAFAFNMVRHTSKLEPPLAQLVNNLTVISTIAEVTFYGQDQVGNDISATGYLQVEFANFADPEADPPPSGS